jgi:Effector-associated domain 9
MLSDSDRRKLTLELADLMKEQDACQSQYRSTLDDAQKVILKRRLENYDAKINNVESQLYGLDLAKDVDANRRSRALENKLTKIDFKEQIRIIDNILSEFIEDGTAIFFVNDSFSMAGDLFRVEFQKILEEDTTDFQHYDIAFTVGGRLDELGFLQGLASYLGIDDIQTKEDYIIICEKIFNLIENGSTILIELRKIDLLDNKDDFLSWLVDIFCKSLFNDLPIICQSKEIEQVKLIILVSSDDDIMEECSRLEFCCDAQCFSKYQIFPITLKEWSEKDINLWLTKHSGLPKNQITPMAKSVYKSSRGGTPKLICDALKSKLS